MLSKTLLLLEKYKDHKLVLSCSGGVDSMVLLHIMVTNSIPFSVFHVNYGKRGRDSEADQKLIQDTCATYSIDAKFVRFDESKYQSSKNFQENARDFRREQLKSLFPDENTLNVMAHHGDDQVETFFMNLSRKSGVMGLASMLSEQENTLRPLLHWSKEEIYAYAKSNEVEWREDASNQEDNYLRNQWRNRLIPLMEKEVPTLKSSTLTLINAFQETQSHIETQTAAIIDFIRATNKFPFKLFDRLTPEYLFEIWRKLGQEATHFKAFTTLRDGQKGKFISLKNSYTRLIKEDTYFYFETEVTFTNNPALKIEPITSLPTNYSKGEVYLDRTKISGELQLRVWQQGDRIAPLGMNGSKLVSDIITDKKVPNHRRASILVLTDDNNILWVPELKVSRKAVATPDSKSIIRITIQ